MQSISFEQQKFILNAKKEGFNGLSLSSIVPVWNIIIETRWNPVKIKSIFRIEVDYFMGAEKIVTMNYSTFYHTSPIQQLFLAPIQAEKYKDKKCNYLYFRYFPVNTEKDLNDPIEMNIAAYQFENNEERNIFISRRQNNNPSNGLFPDHGDAF